VALGDLILRRTWALTAARDTALLARRFALDLAALSSLLALAIAIDRDFLTRGDYIAVSWGDWIGHAYRTQALQSRGLATWDHNWSGGIVLFQDYQFVPHLLTIAVEKLLGVSIGRAMLLMEGLVLIWIRVSGYVTARALGLPAAAALIAGVATFGLNDYAADISTYSALFGLAGTSVLFIAAYRLRDRPAIYAVAAAAGLAIYVHPHLALSGVAALLAVAAVERPSWRSARRLALQLAVVALATAFFWVPAFFSARPVMQDPYSADVTFIRSLYSGEVDRFSHAVWLAVPLAALVALIFSPRLRTRPLRYAAAFFALELFLIALSYGGAGPEQVRLMQNVRLLTVAPLGIGLLCAFAAGAALRWSAGRDRLAAGTQVACLLAALALALPAVRWAADQQYRPTTYRPDSIDRWLTAHQSEVTGRVWLDDLGTALYTYRHFDRLRTVDSHFPVGDWSLLTRPILEGVLLGERDEPTTEQYLRAMGVSHLVLPDSAPLAAKLAPGGSAAGRLVAVARFTDTSPAVTVYRTPWQPVDAFVADRQSLPALDISNTSRYVTAAGRQSRDANVARYAAFAYSADATPAQVEYPSPTTMRVALRGVRAGQALVIDENWDRTWRAATGDGRALAVRRYGPNYIAVDLSGVSGDVVIELRHEMSWDWKAGIALTLLSLPVALAAMFLERKREKM
jgi:hypothetical protein